MRKTDKIRWKTWEKQIRNLWLFFKVWYITFIRTLLNIFCEVMKFSILACQKFCQFQCHIYFFISSMFTLFLKTLRSNKSTFTKSLLNFHPFEVTFHLQWIQVRSSKASLQGLRQNNDEWCRDFWIWPTYLLTRWRSNGKKDF